MLVRLLMKLEFPRQVFGKKYPDFKFNEYPYCESRVVPFGSTDGQTDMTKLLVALRSYANAPKTQQV